MSYIRDRYRKFFYGKKQLRTGAAALIAAGLFAAPFYAEAASKITDSDGNSLIGTEKVHDLYAHEVKDDIAVSRYKDFELAQNEIANMYFHKQDSTVDGSHLVNLVDSRIDINGTVNAIKGNRVGGEIFFLSPDGIAIGKTGVINAGAVDLIVPAKGDFNHLWGKFTGSQWDEDFDAKKLRAINAFDDGDNPWNSDDDPGIEVKGKVNARSGILLGATKIDIATGAELNSLRTIDFTNLVNLSGDAGLSGVGMTAKTDDKSGDILLTANAKNEADDNNLDNITNKTNFVLLSKDTNMAATIDVDGTIKGDAAVKLNATSNTSFQEGEMINVLSQTGLLEKILGGGGVDIAADWVDKTGKAKVTVGENGSITSGDALTLNARSDIKIRLNTATPASKTGNLTGSFLPTTALDVVLFNNDATVDVTGSLTSNANVNGLDAVAAKEHMTMLTATASSTAITVAKAATRTKPMGGVDPDLVYAAVLVEKGDTNASVNLHNNANNSTNNGITSTADLAAVATAVTALDSTVAAVAPSGSVASGAIGYIDNDSNASVNIDKSVSARSVTVNADNHLMRDSLTVSSSLGDADPTVKNPFIVKNKDGTAPGTGMVDALLNPLFGKLTKITDKVDFASGKMSAWRTAGIGNFKFQDLLKGLKLGMSVAATDQHNVSSVRLGQNAAVTAGGPVSLSSKTHADYDGFDYSDYMKFSSVGELNTQKTSKTAKVMVAGSVVGASVENDSLISFESKDGKAASVTSKQGAVTVKADTNMSYNPLESGIKFAVSKLEDFGKALKAAGLDYGETIEEIDKDLVHLHEMDGISAAEGVMDILYNFEDVFLDVVDSLDSTTDAYKAAKTAYSAVISLLDPATFTNYYSRTQAKSNAVEGSAVDIAGTMNIDILKNRATVLADEKVKFSAGGNVDLGAGTKTSTVAMSGNGGKYFTTNQSTGSGLGVTFALQDIGASSLLMLGKDVSVTSGKDVNFTADNQMIQTDIIYGAGESKGKAALTGMLGVITGASDSVVAVDDEVTIDAKNKAAITADNDTVITGIAGGATLGGTQTYAAVGAGLLTLAYDVNNYAIVSDNGTDVPAFEAPSLTDAEKKQIESDVDADIKAGKLDKDSRDAEVAAREDEALQAKKTPDSAASQTISDGVQLAHTMAGNAKVGEQDGDGVSVSSLGTSGYAGIGKKTAEGAARGSITAADFSETANTDGVINSVAVEGTSVSDSHPAVDAFNKYVGKAETFVGMLPQAANWPMDKVSKIIGGKIEGKLNKNKVADGLNQGANRANPNGAAQADLGTQNEVPTLVQIGGAGSLAINLADGETAAIVDNVDVNAKNVALKAEDFLFKGAWAGAAAMNWYGPEIQGNGPAQNIAGSIGGALALNSSSRDVDAILRNAKVTNAEKIENSAEKSGADVAVALGVAVSKTDATVEAGVSASLSYNMSDSDVHVLMINDTVTGNNASIENKAADADVQIAGGVSASVATGDTMISAGVGGSAVANRVRSDVESGVSGGTYTGIKDFGVDAVKSVNQIDAAVAAAFSNNKEGVASGAFTGAVAYNDVDNTTKAFMDKANVTASGNVAVEANDTLGLHRYDDYLTERGVDPSGTSFFGENAKENAKDPKGGAVVGAAVAGEYAGSGGAGIAIVYNASKNDMIAELTDSTVTASSLRAQATDRTTLVSTALGASMGGEYFGGAGAVSWNDIRSTNTANLENNTIKAYSVEGKTLNESRIVNITGEGAGGKGAAAGFNFSFNDLDNTSKATLSGGSVSSVSPSDSKGLTLNLETENKEFDFALGLGVSVSTKTGALAGTAAVTTGDSSAEAKLGDADGTSRTTVSDVKSVNVSAKDSATKITTGGAVDVSGGSLAAVGVSIAYADIGGNSMNTAKADEVLRAEINNADITTKSGATINVKTEDQGSLVTTAAGAGVSVGSDFANLQGAAAVSELAKDAGASVTGSNIDATQGGKNAVVTVSSDSKNKIWTTGAAASFAPSGTVSLGAALSISQINHNTSVAFDGTTANLKSLSLSGKGYSDILANAAGIGIGSTVGLAGSFAYDYIGSNVSAKMSGSTVNADGTIGVVAQSDEEISNYSGTLGGSGTVGAGASVNINYITGSTTAEVGNSTLTAKGNDSGVTVNSDVEDDAIIHTQNGMDNIDPRLSGKRVSSTKKGLVLDSSATHAIASDIASAGIAGSVSLVGTFNENFISGSTTAKVEKSSVNKDAGASSVPADQDMSVRAADYMNLGTTEMDGTGAAYAALGITENTNLMQRETSAKVLGGDTSSNSNSKVNVSDFAVEAVSKKGMGNFALAGSFSGEGANGTVNVIYDGLSGTTEAYVQNTDVTFTNDAKVSADSLDRANMGYYQGALNVEGVGIGLAAGVIEQASTTRAYVLGGSLTGASGSAEVTANNRTETFSSAVGAGASAVGVGGAGTVFVNQFDNTVGVTVDGAKIEAGSVMLAADNNLKSESYGGSAAVAGLGASLGISTLYNSVADKVFVDVTNGSTLNAKTGALDISAATTRDFTQGVATVSGSAFAGIAVNYLGEYINSAVDNDDLKDKIEALNDPSKIVTLNASDFEGLSADEAKRVDSETSFTVSEGKDVQDGDAEGVHVRVQKSTAKAAGATSISATEKNDMMANGDAGSLSLVGISASAVDVRAKRANDISLDGSTVSGSGIDVKAATQDIEDGIHAVSFTGSAGLAVSVEALESVTKTEGNTKVDVKNSNLSASGSTGMISVAAEDSAGIKAESVSMVFGIANIGVLYTKAENTGAAGVSFSGANNVNAGSGGTLTVSASKQNAVDAQSISGAYAAEGGVSYNKTQANDTGSSFVTISGSQNTFTAKNATFAATNAPTLSVDIDQDGGGMIPGLFSYGEINLSSGAAVTAEKDNTFNADTLSFISKVGDEEKTAADVSVASVGVGIADLNVSGDHAYADSSAKATTDIASQKYRGAGGGEKGTALSVSAENDVKKKLDIWNVNVGFFELPCASILSKSTSAELAEAKVAGGDVRSLTLSARGSADVISDSLGSGGALVEAALSGNLAKAETSFDDDAKATLSGAWNIGGGDVQITAIQSDTVNYGAVAGTLAGIDTSGAKGTLTIDGDASAEIADGTSVKDAKNLMLTATNKASVNQDGEHDRNVSGMVATIGGGDRVSSEVNADRSSAVSVGKNAAITTSGAQYYEAYTNADIKNFSYGRATGGVVGGAAVADTTLSAANSVNVGEGASLTSGSSISEGGVILAAHDDLNLTTNAEAYTDGLASFVANANATHTVTRNNAVKVAGAIESAGDVDLYAGANVEGKLSQSNHDIIAESYNYSAIPSISPDVTNKMTETARVDVTPKGKILSNRNVNLLAQGGQESIKTETEAWSWFGGDRQHTDLLGSMNGVKDYGQTAENTVNVDGTIAAGENNDISVKISGEMVPSTSQYPANIEGRNDAGHYDISVTNGKGETLSDIRNNIKTGTFNYGNALVKKWYELTDLINAYEGKEGSGQKLTDKDLEAYTGFVAERAAIEAQMDQLGLLATETQNGKTVTMPISGKDGQAGYDVVYVELPDGLSATGGSINVTGDDFIGTGSLGAVGSTKVDIQNTSNAYLKVGDISIGDNGGNISFNGVLLPSTGTSSDRNTQINNLNLSGSGAAFKGLSPETAQYSEINISNSCSKNSVTMVNPSDSSQKDTYKAISTVEVTGVIDAKSGAVTIDNDSGSIIIDENAGVSGATVKIEASGSFFSGYTPGTKNIGGVPEKYYQSIKGAEGLGGSLNTLAADHKQAYQSADWLKGKDNRSEASFVRANGNITIAATDINVNGLIQSGFNKYMVDIKEATVRDLKAQLASGGAVNYATKTINGRTMYKVCDDAPVRDESGTYFKYCVPAYYDPVEDKIFVEDFAAQGGNITLAGRIVNTALNGEGRIVAATGGADIDIRNASDVALVLGDIENNGRTGTIKIYDLLRPDYDPQNPVTYSQTSGYSSKYEPVKGAIYSWADGYTTETTQYYESDTTKLFGLIETDFTEYEKPENCKKTESENRDLPDGAYTTVDSTFDRDMGAYRITGDSVITNAPVRSDVSTTTDWHFLNKHYYNKWTVTTGSKQTYVHSLLADNPISIDFIASTYSDINIDSAGGVIFAGNVTGYDSDSALNVKSSAGYIRQDSSTFLKGNNFSFDAKGNITGLNLLAFQSTDSYKPTINLSAVSQEGNVGIMTGGADIALRNVAAGVGQNLTADAYGSKNVSLTADGDIYMNNMSGSYGVKGSRIDIDSKGAVGTADRALIVQGGQTPPSNDPMFASVNIKAQRDINVSQQKGDLRVGRIESAGGDVTLTAADGRILDATPEPVTTPTEEALAAKVRRWADAGNIADSEVGANYVGTQTRLAQQSVRNYEDSVRTAWDQYEARKAYYSVDANRNDADRNYLIYKSLDAKFGGYASADDFLAEQKNDPSSNYSALLNVPGAQWTKEMMLYTLRDSVVNKKTGSTDNDAKLANIVGNNITLKSGKGIGDAAAGKETVNLDWLKPGYVDANGKTNVDYIKELSNANDADISVNRDANGNIVSFTVDSKMPVGVYGRKNKFGEEGALLYADSVTTKDGAAVGAYDIYVASRAKSEAEIAKQLTIDQIRTNGEGNVRVFGKQGVIGHSADDTFTIVGKDLLIEGGNGEIRNHDGGAFYTGLCGTLTARANGNISVQNYLTGADGTAKVFVPDAKDNFTGDVSRFETLGIGAVYSPGEVSLAGYKNIIMGESADAIAYINAGERVVLTTLADGGAIGTQKDPIRILANGSAVCAMAANGNGNAYIDFVEPSLDDLDVQMKTPRLGRVRANRLHVRSVNGLTQTDEGIWADLLRVWADGHVTLTSRNNRFNRFLGASRLGGRLNGNFHVSALTGDRFRSWMMGRDFSFMLDGRFSQEWFEWLASQLNRFEADMMLRIDYPMRLDRGPIFFTGGDLLAYYRGRDSEVEEEEGTRNATVDEIVVES